MFINISITHLNTLLHTSN